MSRILSLQHKYTADVFVRSAAAAVIPGRTQQQLASVLAHQGGSFPLPARNEANEKLLEVSATIPRAQKAANARSSSETTFSRALLSTSGSEEKILESSSSEPREHETERETSAASV